jgi:hypothetical protein
MVIASSRRVATISLCGALQKGCVFKHNVILSRLEGLEFLRYNQISQRWDDVDTALAG